MSMGIIFELMADLRRWKNDKKINNYSITIVTKDENKLKES
jgi:hypothetical protein